MQPQEIARAVDLVARILPVTLPQPMRTKLARVMALLPMGLRTTAHMLVLLRRVAALMSPHGRTALRLDTWMTVVVALFSMILET